MATPISGQMRANLLAVTSLNDDMTMTQNRLNTGRKVNTALDDPATYFKAQNFTNRASSIDGVNKNIALAMSNVKQADGAMTTMLKNMNAQLTAMKDAKSVASGTAAAAVAITGKVAFAATDSMLDVAANNMNANKFQNGDVVSMTITNSAGVSQTRFFQAATTPATTGNGLTATTGIQFNDAKSLMDAVKAAFGDTQITVPTLGATAANLSLTLKDPASSLNITQVTNKLNTGDVAASNNVADIGAIFGMPTAAAALAAPPVVSDLAQGRSITYSPTAATVNQASLDTRKAVADGYRTMLNQMSALVSDAYVPGQVNLLNTAAGNVVNLNADGSNKQTLKLGSMLDVATLGFNFNVATQASTDATGNFATDVELQNAMNKLDKAIQTVTREQKSLANQSAMLNNRSSFNKDMMNDLNGNSDLLIAADATVEAANLASMQTKQAFATNNMSLTKQNESGLIQLLR
ncbi:hypothetical protein GCM10007036_34390 [Alsobacter metallidurans]|uniref:Flagellin N-terminal domain-containing protein n=1 Tax=Alsobacter metallidurans TaxID=340221 RepID=A0A917MJG3_9HYPH|nr:hypothetical protein [Alsobacter metallidurans]GGH26529.1 hypothetical protein GCM10007036_34390 [Alsobacter metallidurans]